MDVIINPRSTEERASTSPLFIAQLCICCFVFAAHDFLLLIIFYTVLFHLNVRLSFWDGADLNWNRAPYLSLAYSSKPRNRVLHRSAWVLHEIRKIWFYLGFYIEFASANATFVFCTGMHGFWMDLAIADNYRLTNYVFHEVNLGFAPVYMGYYSKISWYSLTHESIRCNMKTFTILIYGTRKRSIQQKVEDENEWEKYCRWGYSQDCSCES